MGTDRKAVTGEASGVLAEFSLLLVDEADGTPLLPRVLDVAMRAVGGCDGASVSLLEDGDARTAVASSAGILAVDEAQYAAAGGPSLTACREQRIVRIDLGAPEPEWAGFCEVAGVIGINSFLAAPLRTGAEAFGALNLYSRSVAGFAALDDAFIGLLSAQVATVVTNGLRYAHATALAGQLREAMESRAVIEQAKGVLIALHGIDADEAFQALRRESQRTNTKLREVAGQLVSRAQAREAQRPQRASVRPQGRAAR